MMTMVMIMVGIEDDCGYEDAAATNDNENR